MAPFMAPMMLHFRVYDFITHLNHMIKMHWVIVMKLNMAQSEGEALGSEEAMVRGTGEVLGSTIGAANNVNIGLDDGTGIGSLVGSLEGSNVQIPKGAFLWDQIEEAICGD